jgi:CRISPR-associated protein Csy3
VHDGDGQLIAEAGPAQLPDRLDHLGPDELHNEALVEGIRGALAGETGPYRITVTGEGMIGPGQEVFPSQEFIDPARRTGAAASNKSRHLAYVDATVGVGKDARSVRQAIFHPQKIGNWIRRIDDWYDDDATFGPIAVEPYGMMLDRFNAARWPSKQKDLYSHLDDKRLPRLIEAVEAAESRAALPAEAHFVMACLVRGGVFSAESQK